jgi:hypothetical protein
VFIVVRSMLRQKEQKRRKKQKLQVKKFSANLSGPSVMLRQYLALGLRPKTQKEI